MAIVALDQSFADLIDLDTEPEAVTTGYSGLEGPVWSKKEKALIFSDLSKAILYRWSASDGASVIRENTGIIGGNTFDRDGFLISTDRQAHRISRTLADGSVETVVDSYKGRSLNHPNDLVLAPNG